LSRGGKPEGGGSNQKFLNEGGLTASKPGTIKRYTRRLPDPPVCKKEFLPWRRHNDGEAEGRKSSKSLSTWGPVRQKLFWKVERILLFFKTGMQKKKKKGTKKKRDLGRRKGGRDWPVENAIEGQ